MKTATIGIDFGTTNSSIAFADVSGDVQLARFIHLEAPTDSYRSLLYLEQLKERGVNTLKSWSGPAGIEHYLSGDGNGRLMQSLKSFLSSRSLQTTEVFGRRYTLVSLIARMLRDLKQEAETQFEVKIGAAVVGRPVQFVGTENDDDNQYAENRLREALGEAGFASVEFELEPVAAARYYESTLDHDQLILIGDFGGGTSDFSLIRVGPGIRTDEQKKGAKNTLDKRKTHRKSAALLGNAGIGLAGDAFDAKIVRHLVAPALGAGSQMRSLDKLLPVPGWVYNKLERWHHLSFLKARDTMEMLRGVQGHALEPEKIRALIHLIKEDLGFRLHRAVQAVKSELSHNSTATFKFDDGYVEIETSLARDVFESWIADELGQIESCVDSLLSSAGVQRDQVDAIFLTGGTSFVPAVRRIFQTRFGEDKIRAGNEFTSVAYGLALRAAKIGSR